MCIHSAHILEFKFNIANCLALMMAIAGMFSLMTVAFGCIEWGKFWPDLHGNTNSHIDQDIVSTMYTIHRLYLLGVFSLLCDSTQNQAALVIDIISNLATIPCPHSCIQVSSNYFQVNSILVYICMLVGTLIYIYAVTQIITNKRILYTW